MMHDSSIIDRERDAPATTAAMTEILVNAISPGCDRDELSIMNDLLAQRFRGADIAAHMPAILQRIAARSVGEK